MHRLLNLAILLLLLVLPRSAEAHWVEVQPGGGPEAAWQIQVSEENGVTTVHFRLYGYHRDAPAVGSRFEAVRVPGLETMRVAGRPALPRVLVPLALAQEAEILDVRVVEAVRERAIVPLPFSPRPKRCGSGTWRSHCDESTYNGDAAYPGERAAWREEGRMRGRHVAVLELAPFRYLPHLRTLEVATEIEVDLAGELLRKAPARFQSTTFGKLTRGGFHSLFEEDREGEGRELVLVIAHDDLLGALEEWVAWKEQMGYEILVVPLSAVGNSHTEVKEYLQAAYDNWETVPTYVLLVGDGQGAATVPFVPSPYGCASDFLYSTLDGNDLFSDVIIGRVSAHTEGEVALQLAKAIWYEQQLAESPTEWLPRSVCISSSEGSGGSNDDVRSDIICDLQAAHDYGVTDKLYHSNGQDTASNISAKINDGRGWVTYLGHGSGHSWATTTPPYSNTHVEALQNDFLLPFVVDVSCSNGEFDSPSGDCFAEAWMKTGTPEALRAGAVIYSASTPTAWDEPAEMAVGMSHALLDDGIARWGALAAAGRAYMLGLYDNNNAEEVCHQYVVFGDPTLMVRTRVSVELDVDHPAAIPLGGVDLPVSVTAQGEAVDKAQVALLLADGQVVAGKTNAQGTVTLWVEAETVGAATLTVTAADATPYVAPIDTLVPGCGMVQLQPALASCSTALNVVLFDADLNTDAGAVESVVVSADAPGEAELPLTLVETAADSGKFAGVLQLTPNGGPGTLAVSHGETVTVTYADGACADGTGEKDAAVAVDCEPPVVSSVVVDTDEPAVATVTFDTDEPASGTVLSGTVQPPAEPHPFPVGVAHQVQVTGLEPETTYFLAIEATDEAGNTALGDEVEFTTPACTPECAGKQCGPDGCGGVCGGCCEGQSCENGQCVGGPGCEPSDDPGCGGCPCEECVCELDGFCCEVMWDDICVGECISDCGGCGAEAHCAGKECGPDGCGGLCGTCPEEWFCTDDGQCVEECDPECDGKNCGSDGCGGVCGTCHEGESCVEGVCLAPCGEIDFVGCCDGTRQVFCEGGWQLTVDCADQGLTCGWKGALGWYDCVVEQVADPSGEYPLWCPGVCPPQCEGLECGPDGCGGSCGECGDGESCQNGQCKPDCDPQCGTKVCGDDGCGGQCGECPIGETCHDGLCVNPCLPQCEGKQCGDDGCGGVCGKCAPGMECSEQFMCVVHTEEPDVISEDVTVVEETPEPAKGGGCSSAPDMPGPVGSGILLLMLLSLLAIRPLRGRGVRHRQCGSLQALR